MSRGPDAHTLLQRALSRSADQAGCPIEWVTSDWERWASATFVGARHRLTLTLAEGAASENWLAGLDEAEVELRGHLLADLVVTGAEHGGGHIAVTLEALTVEDR